MTKTGHLIHESENIKGQREQTQIVKKAIRLQSYGGNEDRLAGCYLAVGGGGPLY